ncbi:MAG TPA: indole-3-glycerol phosphate synthase TrpC [Planctomycetota bacterium]|nr:indole-3-glycerol phosphate synthase TrpC [Planctomycetota bacterium]
MSDGSALDEIVAGVREDLEERRRALHVEHLELLAAEAPRPPSFGASLRRGEHPRVIAELKRASPSRGPIAPGADAAKVAISYANAGAAAISVLTERRRFGGSLEDLARAATALELRAPILRKDFIVDRYQLLEARAAGASAALLIAALLEVDPLGELISEAKAIGVETLVEVHDAKDLARALEAGATIIGVNNRDLRTLEVTLETSRRLGPRIPAGCIRVAESGIKSRAEIDELAALGFDAFLVGERLMSENDPGAALARLMGSTGTAPGDGKQ